MSGVIEYKADSDTNHVSFSNRELVIEACNFTVDGSHNRMVLNVPELESESGDRKPRLITVCGDSNEVTIVSSSKPFDLEVTGNRNKVTFQPSNGAERCVTLRLKGRKNTIHSAVDLEATCQGGENKFTGTIAELKVTGAYNTMHLDGGSATLRGFCNDACGLAFVRSDGDCCYFDKCQTVFMTGSSNVCKHTGRVVSNGVLNRVLQCGDVWCRGDRNTCEANSVNFVGAYNTIISNDASPFGDCPGTTSKPLPAEIAFAEITFVGIDRDREDSIDPQRSGAERQCANTIAQPGACVPSDSSPMGFRPRIMPKPALPMAPPLPDADRVPCHASSCVITPPSPRPIFETTTTALDLDGIDAEVTKLRALSVLDKETVKLNKMCYVCAKNKRACFYSPCNHRVLCYGCASSVLKEAAARYRNGLPMALHCTACESQAASVQYDRRL